MYHKDLPFLFIPADRIKLKFLNKVRDESKKIYLLVLPPIFYEENESFSQRIRENGLGFPEGMIWKFQNQK